MKVIVSWWSVCVFDMVAVTWKCCCGFCLSDFVNCWMVSGLLLWWKMVVPKVL